ncbi:MAG: phosphotransferase [Alcanivoracaceae bacterium]
MSVFTTLHQQDLIPVLAEAELTLLAFRPASAGIENSNYLIDATDPQGRRRDVVLTLFEQLPASALPWFAEVLAAAAAAGLPVPCPIPLPRGTVFELAGKPAMLVPRLPGQHLDRPEPDHCRQIGAALARLHQVTVSSPTPLPHEREVLGELMAELPKGPERTKAAALLQRWLSRSGPRVLVHGDLFRDNALFNGDQLSGLLDFYHACHDHPVYDLAVAINDWCIDPSGEPLLSHQTALLEGYESERSLSAEGLELMDEALTVAALRFWLSRLRGRHQTALDGQGSKDPEEFARLYRRRLAALDG